MRAVLFGLYKSVSRIRPEVCFSSRILELKYSFIAEELLLGLTVETSVIVCIDALLRKKKMRQTLLYWEFIFHNVDSELLSGALYYECTLISSWYRYLKWCSWNCLVFYFFPLTHYLFCSGLRYITRYVYPFAVDHDKTWWVMSEL